MREILGGKGANLAEMALIGLPVPPGFTLSTEVCGYFYGNSGNYPKGLENAVSKAISEVEKQQNKGFGDGFVAAQRPDFKRGWLAAISRRARPLSRPSETTRL